MSLSVKWTCPVLLRGSCSVKTSVSGSTWHQQGCIVFTGAMELDLSPPHLSGSPEDVCPAPGTPPETPPPPDNPPSGDVKRSQPLPIPSSRSDGAVGLHWQGDLGTGRGASPG